MAHLRSTDSPPASVAVVAGEVPDLPREGIRGDVRIDSYLPDEVSITAHMETSGVVVLSDLYYPGWRAEVDDAETPIIRADYFLRGVLVPAGTHRVSFRYEPPSFRIGAWISAVALLGVLLAAGRRGRNG